MERLNVTLNRKKLAQAIREKLSLDSQNSQDSQEFQDYQDEQYAEDYQDEQYVEEFQDAQDSQKNQKSSLSLRKLEKITGVSASTLSRILNADTYKPGSEHLIAICCWLRRPPESFFNGVPGSLRVRYHSPTPVNAGKPAPAENEHELKDLCEELMPDQDEYFTVPVNGVSMIGEHIYHGDLLIARKSSEANSDDIVIADIAGEYCVKIFKQIGGSIFLFSANTEPDPDGKYAPILFKKGTQPDIIGVVTHVVHRQHG